MFEKLSFDYEFLIEKVKICKHFNFWQNKYFLEKKEERDKYS